MTSGGIFLSRKGKQFLPRPGAKFSPCDSPPGINPIHSSVPGPQAPSDSFSAWERNTNYARSLKNVVIHNSVILLLGLTLSQ